MESETNSVKPEAALSHEENGVVQVHLQGGWTLGTPCPPVSDVLRELTAVAKVQKVTFDSKDLKKWGSSLVSYVSKLKASCTEMDVPVDDTGLPEGVRRLLDLAAAASGGKTAGAAKPRESFVARVGTAFLDNVAAFQKQIVFAGAATLAFGNLLRGKARYRPSELGLQIQQCGADALGIVTVISILVGTIVAFMGAVQLKMFGAQMYVADMVAIGMTREMAALMTGIIMAGRTGAAFAAQLGTMQVNEEIDALQTMGFDPMEFLVLPRMLALILMMPLLYIYSTALGILGGALIGVGLLDLTPMQYWIRTTQIIGLDDIGAGLIKSAVFGVLVAVSGCMRGIQCGRSASAVGEAATQAVVTGILYIIISDAVLSIVFTITGF
jgi:phospholipid/cholesterol/gamma-HCH transport system permease protein